MKSRAGMTFVEVLVASAIAAAVIVVAVIGFGTIASLPQKAGRIDVSLPGGVHAALYGEESTYITVSPNPSYYEGVQAAEMRARLHEDVAAASAVFCLGRNGSGGVRPSSLPVPAGTDFRTNSSPQAFRNFLVASVPNAGTIFPSGQRGVLNHTNATLFVLSGLENTTTGTNSLFVISTYEMDVLEVTDPPGLFVTVRRFSTAARPTHYFHLFYPEGTATASDFTPWATFFERSALPAEGNSTVDLYKVAPNHPFTFLWWPDPLVEAPGRLPSSTAGTGTTREGYIDAAGRTSLFFVLPAFPPL